MKFLKQFVEDMKALKVIFKLAFMSSEDYSNLCNREKLEYEKKYNELYNKLLDKYIEDIRQDHEEDEIEECIRSYKEFLKTKTKVLLYDFNEEDKKHHDVEWKLLHDDNFKYSLHLRLFKYTMSLWLIPIIVLLLKILLGA